MRFGRRRFDERCRSDQVPDQRFGIVGGDYPTGETGVGKVRAVGVGGRVGQV